MSSRHISTTVAQLIIERINTVYSHQEAQADGIYFWPEPLPAPVAILSPDPLVLFRPGDEATLVPNEKQQERLPLVSMSMPDFLALRNRDIQKPSMQIPLGLIDKPEIQQREAFLVDLHGSAGALTGGPLLIAGAQHSGKATSLQTILLWLTVRFSPRQLRFVLIDPLHELDFFQDVPHMQSGDGTSLWTDGSTDEKITKIADYLTQVMKKRREEHSHTRWNNDTLMHLWSQGIEIPQTLLIISHYHSFVDRPVAAMALKKLAMSMLEARTMGAYLVITTAEVGMRYLPPDLTGKFATKIGLLLNEQQRLELFGRVPMIPEPVPGRGLALTPDRSTHQVQLALPVDGPTENQRNENLKKAIHILIGQDR